MHSRGCVQERGCLHYFQAVVSPVLEGNVKAWLLSKAFLKMYTTTYAVLLLSLCGTQLAQNTVFCKVDHGM